MSDPIRVALDENFPLDLIRKLGDVIPGAELRSVYEIDERFEGLDDWQVVVALYRRNWQVLATSDFRMANEARSLMAVDQTRMTLVAVEGLGHNSVRATGALLLELPAMVKKYVADRPQVFRWRPRDPKPESPQHFLGLMSNRTGLAVQELMTQARLSEAELADPLGAENHGL